MAEINTGNPAAQPLRRTRTRNQSIECFRLIASIMVVLVHYQFPGILGKVIDCLARFSVPFFFIVSGYFIYQADDTVIRKRIRSIVKLNIYSTGLYLLWGSYQEKYLYGRGRLTWLLEKLSAENLSSWVIISTNPFSIHLWYLTAILACYLAVYLYVRWQGKDYNYKTLYIVSFLLYAVHVVMGSFMSAIDYDISTKIYRNALLYGLPMFSLGIFLREYQSKIVETYGLSAARLVAIIFAGAGFSLLEWFGTGDVEMPIGTLFEVIAIMLLLVSKPHIFRDHSLTSAISTHLGELSLIIYVIHPLWIDIYDWYIRDQLSVFGESATEYLSPVVIVLLSVFSGVMWMLIKAGFRKLRLHRK